MFKFDARVVFNGEKLRFALIHAGFSIVAVLALFAIVGLCWYPGIFFQLEKVLPVMLIVGVVDALLGPFLSYVVYSKNKARYKLVMNMVVIIAIQVSAMGYGAYTLYFGKPSYVAYYSNAFYVIAENIVRAEAEGKEPAFDTQEPVPWVNVKHPNSFLDVEKYQLIDDVFNEFIETNRYLGDHLEANPDYKKAYRDFFDKNNIEESDVRFFPLLGNHQYMMVGFSISKKKMIDVLWVPYPVPNDLVYDKTRSLSILESKVKS